MTSDSPEFEFDRDTAVRCVTPGVYEATISDRWNIGPVPNGGYVMAIGMAAVRATLPSPHPLSATAHYLRPARPGAARVYVETIKIGRRFSTATARLVQNDQETVRMLATYGNLSRGGGPTHIAGAPPPLPPREQLTEVQRDAFAPEFGRRFQMLSSNLSFEPGRARGAAEVSGWIRFADGRLPDAHALGLIADAFPPAAFHVLAPGWVPTLELTVHVRALPRSEWLRCVFRVVS